MAKLPLPQPDRLRALKPATLILRTGTPLARIGFAGGPHPSAWNQFRYWGPTASRFDHHLRNARGSPHRQDRGVLYAARMAQTCLAEVYQATRIVDVHRNQPYLVVWTLAADLTLLDLTGVFATRMGASTAIHSGPRPRAQRWAAALYAAYPDLDGIAYCSSMNGNADAFALNERALNKAPFAPTPNVNRMLADPLIADLIDEAAEDLRYMVRR
jgi:RES domain